MKILLVFGSTLVVLILAILVFPNGEDVREGSEIRSRIDEIINASGLPVNSKENVVLMRVKKFGKAVTIRNPKPNYRVILGVIKKSEHDGEFHNLNILFKDENMNVITKINIK